MKDNTNSTPTADNRIETAVLVGLIHQQQTETQLHEYLDELAFLTETAGAVVKKRFTQKMLRPDTRTFVGKGKLAEIADYVNAAQIDLVIFDDDLSPKQQAILEKELKVKVMDRSFLILDIFARRAQTAQAKTQVELAQMQYLLPRLKGLWTHLERQRGGVGMRGPGEQEIETDRRIVKEKIAMLKRRLIDIDKQNITMRKQRGELIRVSLVGYTNVGKSTLMTLLSKSEVFVENKLFATLDTTVRKVVLQQTPFLLSDTVGFIRKLPHALIESFKSTLDEVREADILIHVVDIAHPQFEEHITVVNQTLREVTKNEEKPPLIVFNKIDLYRDTYLDEFLKDHERTEIMNDLWQMLQSRYPDGHCALISATAREGIDDLREKLVQIIQQQYAIRYPYKTTMY